MRRKRDIMNQMRRDLHDHMLVPAFYRAAPDDEWIPVDVRVHSKATVTGNDVDGAPMEGVGVRDIQPRIIFMRDQVALPARGAIVSIDATEAWQIADAEKPDGITITAACTPISAAKIAAEDYPVRDDE